MTVPNLIVVHFPFQPADLNKWLWDQLNKHQLELPFPTMLSFMVDRTVEHFRLQLIKKKKKQAAEKANAAVDAALLASSKATAAAREAAKVGTFKLL